MDFLLCPATSRYFLVDEPVLPFHLSMSSAKKQKVRTLARNSHSSCVPSAYPSLYTCSLLHLPTFYHHYDVVLPQLLTHSLTHPHTHSPAYPLPPSTCLEIFPHCMGCDRPRFIQPGRKSLGTISTAKPGSAQDSSVEATCREWFERITTHKDKT